MIAELLLAEGTSEETPLVRLAVEIDDKGALELCFGENHRWPPL
jgi:hypothetical protein